MHDNWEGKTGHTYFYREIELPEAMNLNLRMGYDGPFRIWIDSKPIFINMNGTNPCIPDETICGLKMAKGKHSITIGMDVNEGRTWGFYLRFNRLDVTRRAIDNETCALPLLN